MSKSKPEQKPSGNFQAPPAGAPHQVTAPLTSDDRAGMLERARMNEKELPPFNPQPTGGPTKHVMVPTPQNPGGPAVTIVAEAPPPVAAGDGGGEAGAEGVEVAGLDALATEFAPPPMPPPDPRFVIPDHGADGPRRPAESNTDSPSRGVPHRPSDPGKVITGGWGDGGGEYFALDGGELAKVTATLFGDLQRQMSADLRFGIATVYPQVRVRVQVLVDGIDPSVPVNEQKFDLGLSRVLELDAMAADDQDTPADALRDQANLPKPRKQKVGGISVDVPIHLEV